MTQTITLYGHATCPGVPPIKALLAQAHIPYVYVDIHRDPQAAVLVRSINHGNESVPTITFPDGSSLTEPSVGELQRKLATFGYKVGWLAWVLGNSWRIITGTVVLYGLLRLFEII